LKHSVACLHGVTENAETPYSATVVINDIKYGTGYASSKRSAKLEAGTRIFSDIAVSEPVSQ